MAEQDKLSELPGVGPATAEKLIDAGYMTYKSIASENESELANTADIGDNTAVDIVRAAREEAEIGGFNSAMDISDKRQNITKISTLVPDLDNMLEGGIESQSITEFYGGFGAGKSQVTHQLCVNVQLPIEHGGAEGSAIFIDTEDSFRPERITEMVKGLPEDVLADVIKKEDVNVTVDDIKNSNVYHEGKEDTTAPVYQLSQLFQDRIEVAQSSSASHQMLLVDEAIEIVNNLSDTEFPAKLFVVDSVISHFRAEHVGRGELAKRQQKLNRHIHDLKRLGDMHNMAIVIANQVQSNPDSYFGDPTKPTGGNILGHNSTFRLYLRNSKNNNRVVKLVDAPNLPDAECVVKIKKSGVKPE